MIRLSQYGRRITSYRFMRRLSLVKHSCPYRSLQSQQCSLFTTAPALPSIELSKSEDKIFSFLRKVVDNRKLDVNIRVAGGWVRDKLWGLQSDDIDLALDTMNGREFAQELRDYMKDEGLNLKQGIVRYNPAQSKHLETVMIELQGYSLDVVHLRTETYASESRIPLNVSLGTPSSDAMRRDFTINALFYNLHTQSIEDHTGRGLADLASKTLRTPLPTRETFEDDPLRLVRGLRFASVYRLTMDAEIVTAMSDPSLHKLIRSKCSAERIGKEFVKLAQANDFHRAFVTVLQCGLQDTLFPLRSEGKARPWCKQEFQASVDRLGHLQRRLADGTIPTTHLSRLELMLSYLMAPLADAHAAAGHPWSMFNQNDHVFALGKFSRRHDASVWAAMNELVMDGLRLDAQTGKMAHTLVQVSQFFVDSSHRQSLFMLSLSLGNKRHTIDEAFFAQLVHALLLAGPEGLKASVWLAAARLVLRGDDDGATGADQKIESLATEWLDQLQWGRADGLASTILTAERLIDGKLLLDTFGNSVPKPQFQQILDAAFLFQLQRMLFPLPRQAEGFRPCDSEELGGVTTEEILRYLETAFTVLQCNAN